MTAQAFIDESTRWLHRSTTRRQADAAYPSTLPHLPTLFAPLAVEQRGDELHHAVSAVRTSSYEGDGGSLSESEPRGIARPISSHLVPCFVISLDPTFGPGPKLHYPLFSAHPPEREHLWLVLENAQDDRVPLHMREAIWVLPPLSLFLFTSSQPTFFLPIPPLPLLACIHPRENEGSDVLAGPSSTSPRLI